MHVALVEKLLLRRHEAPRVQERSVVEDETALTPVFMECCTWRSNCVRFVLESSGTSASFFSCPV